MTAELGVLRQSWRRNCWPGFVAGLQVPLIRLLLKRWLPFHFAIGIAAFATWFGVGLIFARRSQPNYGIPRWVAGLIAGLVSGLCFGLVTYYIPLK